MLAKTKRADPEEKVTSAVPAVSSQEAPAPLPPMSLTGEAAVEPHLMASRMSLTTGGKPGARPAAGHPQEVPDCRTSEGLRCHTSLE
jgi:hypothetical protein